MRIDIMTLFPETTSSVLHESILGRACEKGILDINCIQIRDYTENKQRQVDDYPYGGGWGCVMMAQPLKSCLDSIMQDSGERRSRVIYMSPQGKTFNQEKAKQLARDYDHLVLVCGHYEGIDERFIEECVDEEISIGDFVLTGGEIAAMAVCDSVCRMMPGVLSSEECYTGESHWDGLLEYPQYTRPENWEGKSVPEVLKGGNHADIEAWRRKQSIIRTRDKRPDMFQKLTFEGKDAKLFAEVKRDESRIKLTKPVTLRLAEHGDLEQIMKIRSDASKYLKKYRIDQWQDEYPQESDFENDINNGECYVAVYDDSVVAVLVLIAEPQKDYVNLTDGKWLSDGEYLSIHRFAALAEYRGSGLSAKVIALAEDIAKKKGVFSIKVDTHKKNKAMCNLLRKSDYKYCGNVVLDVEPGHDGRRQAFEKLL